MENVKQLKLNYKAGLSFKDERNIHYLMKTFPSLDLLEIENEDHGCENESNISIGLISQSLDYLSKIKICFIKCIGTECDFINYVTTLDKISSTFFQTHLTLSNRMFFGFEQRISKRARGFNFYSNTHSQQLYFIEKTGQYFDQLKLREIQTNTTVELMEHILNHCTKLSKLSIEYPEESIECEQLALPKKVSLSMKKLIRKH